MLTGQSLMLGLPPGTSDALTTNLLQLSGLRQAFDSFLFFKQMITDTVQVVRKYSQAGIASIGCVPFVRATIQSVMFQTVDVAFYATVFIGQLAPPLLALPILVGRGEFTFLGHDYFNPCGLVLASTATGTRTTASQCFDPAAPVCVFAPTCQVIGLTEACTQFNALACAVPAQVQVGGEMHGALKGIAIDFN